MKLGPEVLFIAFHLLFRSTIRFVMLEALKRPHIFPLPHRRSRSRTRRPACGRAADDLVSARVVKTWQMVGRMGIEDLEACATKRIRDHSNIFPIKKVRSSPLNP